MIQFSSIKSQGLKDSLAFLEAFYSKSTIYEFGNYISLKADSQFLYFALPLIVGENVANGLLQVRVPHNNEAGHMEEVTLSMAKLIQIKKILDIDLIDIIYEAGKRVTFRAGKIKHTIPTSVIEIPEVLWYSFNQFSGVDTVIFPNQVVADITTTLARELSNNSLVDLRFKGIYLSSQASYVTDGVKIVKYNEPIVGLPNDLFLPDYMGKVLSKIKESHLQYATKVIDEDKSPYIFLEGDNFRMVFAEWFGKDIYPIKQIDMYMTAEREEVPLEYITKGLAYLSDLASVSVLDFENGRVYTKDGEGYSEALVEPVKGMRRKIFSSRALPAPRILKGVEECGIAADNILYLRKEQTEYVIMRMSDEEFD